MSKKIYVGATVNLQGNDAYGRNWVTFIHNQDETVFAEIRGATKEEAEGNANAVVAAVDHASFSMQWLDDAVAKEEAARVAAFDATNP